MNLFTFNKIKSKDFDERNKNNNEQKKIRK